MPRRPRARRLAASAGTELATVRGRSRRATARCRVLRTAPRAPRPSLRAARALPLVGAGVAWGLAVVLRPACRSPGTDLGRLTALALVLAGPATTVGAIMARAWWPRLVGVVVAGGLAAAVFIGRVAASAAELTPGGRLRRSATNPNDGDDGATTARQHEPGASPDGGSGRHGDDGHPSRAGGAKRREPCVTPPGHATR